jgi:transposase InsO family protein
MCSTLSVSRSGYYAWRHRPQSQRSKANQELRSRIRAIREGSGKTYGAPRIADELRDEGFPCSTKRVARLMRLEGLRAQWKKRFRVTTASSHRLPEVVPYFSDR